MKPHPSSSWYSTCMCWLPLQPRLCRQLWGWWPCQGAKGSPVEKGPEWPVGRGEVISLQDRAQTWVIFCFFVYSSPCTYIYIYGTPPPKPTFLHFLLVCTVFLAYLGTFVFFWHFLNDFEAVFTNVYKRYGPIAADLDPRSKIQDSRKNFLDPRSGSKIQDSRKTFLDPRSGSKIQDSRKNFLDPKSGSKIQDPRF